VDGKYGENLRLSPLPRDLPAAQKELGSFVNVKAQLVEVELQTKPFSCES